MGHIRIYVRVSTSEQAETGLSLDTQIESCARYAALKGHSGPFCVYIDAGISAKNMTGRPSLNQMFEDAQADDLIIAAKLDRLFRNVRDASDTMERLRKNRVALALLDLAVDTSNSAGEMVFNLMAAFAQFERKRTGERIVEVNRRIVSSEGRWIGSTPPYGYHYNATSQLLEIEDAESVIVTRIFALYATGEHGAQNIAHTLNTDGYRTRRNAYWTTNAVLRILRNPIYKGEVLFGRGSSTWGQDWHTLDDHPAWVRSQGQHTGIVSPETWDTAHRVLRGRGTGKRPPSKRILYSGFAFCAACYGRMILKDADGRKYYQCRQNFLTKGAACREASMMLSSITEEVVSEALARNIAALKDALKARRKPRGVKKTVTQTRNREYWLRRREKLGIAWLDDTIPEAEYNRRLREIQEGIAALEREEETAVLPVTLDFVEASEVSLGSDRLSIPEKRELIHLFLERILIGRDTVTLHYRDFGLPGWVVTEEIARPKRKGPRKGSKYKARVTV